MEELMQLIRKALPSGHSIPDAIIAKLAALLILAYKNLGEQLATDALRDLKALGVPFEQLTSTTVMAYAARKKLEQLNAIGLLSRYKFLATRMALVKAIPKDDPRYPYTTEMAKVAFLSDVVALTSEHYLPTRQLLGMVEAGADIRVLPTEEYTSPRPYSDAARACVTDLNNVNFATYKIRPLVHDPMGMDEILSEVWVTEAEAARIIRVTPKTLADRRRAGMIPAGLYVQQSKNGSVHYRREKWVEYANGEEVKTRKTK